MKALPEGAGGTPPVTFEPHRPTGPEPAPAGLAERVLRLEILAAEGMRRMDRLDVLAEGITDLKADLKALRERLEGQNGRLAWLWTLLGLLLGGLVGAAFRLLLP
ncbi:MAG TPA: hypothetical protein VHN99_08880 [Deinococcales bacterium]|nr:hypothetical protein [Deinococcales bacterium]